MLGVRPGVGSRILTSVFLTVAVTASGLAQQQRPQRRPAASAQPARAQAEPAGESEKVRERENLHARQAWFLHGRSLKQGSSSERLLRAYLEQRSSDAQTLQEFLKARPLEEVRRLMQEPILEAV